MTYIVRKFGWLFLIISLSLFFFSQVSNFPKYKINTDYLSFITFRLVRDVPNSNDIDGYIAAKLNLLSDYLELTKDKESMVQLLKDAWNLRGKKIVEINSTESGGGVAALLSARKRFYQKIGVDWSWKIVKGDGEFSAAVKRIFNGLQGENQDITLSDLEALRKTCSEFAADFKPEEYDVIVVHDNILPLIEYFQDRLQKLTDEGVITKEEWPKFIWRSHMDTTNPDLGVWEQCGLKEYVNRYDSMVATKPEYIESLKGIEIPTSTIFPAIDPLDSFNREVTSKEIEHTLNKIGLSQDDRIIAHISRFDKWKGYPDTIKMFQELKSEGKIEENVKLVLIGESASDDDEGGQQLNDILDLVGDDPDIKVLLKGTVPEEVNPDNIIKIEVLEQNVIQWIANVIVHPAYAAGFEMSLTSSLLKSFRDLNGDEIPEGRVVIASKVGGIPDQIRLNPVNGLLIPAGKMGADNSEKIAKMKEAVIDALNPDRSDVINLMGRGSKDRVVENFLITNIVSSWLKLFNLQLNPSTP